MKPCLQFGLATPALALLAAGLMAGDNRPPADPKPAAVQQDVLLLFHTRCTKYHGDNKPKARLVLTDLKTLARGSRSGPVVVPGALDQSVLWQVVHDGKMPPKQPLPQAERLVLRRWIEAGAPGLQAIAAGGASQKHWAFRSPTRPPVPVVRHAEPVRTPIDCFITAALEAAGLAMSPEADRATLLRRVSFDLTGLPPTPEEIGRFLADRRPDAYERLVEHYLASPHYGERWGKYWLDAAGYADSNGYFNADTDRPLAYRYRDYVIRAFNEDRPYDRFAREQLAGDELAGYVPGGDVTAEMVEPLVATHFLRNAPDGTGESDGNPDEVRTDRFTVLEGNLQNTMNCLLGITIQCARCHSHKFEPISQEEYYQLQAILYPAYCPDRWTKPKDRVVAVGTRAWREEHQRRTEQVDRQVKALRDGLETIAEPFRESLIAERLSHLEPAVRSAVLQALKTPAAKRAREQQDLLRKHVEPLKINDDDVAKRFPEFAAVREEIRKAVAAREKERPAPLEMLAPLVETDPNPPVHHVLLRGQHNAPGPEVQPGVPAALRTSGNSYHLPVATGKTPGPQPRISTGRRLAFARWVTAADNPLFARVMVNRIWQHHFGTGLVSTPDNLGRSGSPPSHPELLDYLATEFIRSGWSVKAMHRLILKSAVYRQASSAPHPTLSPEGRGKKAALAPEGKEEDDRMLWRFPLLRLDAEAIRDAMLAVGGELDVRMGGQYVPTRRTGEGVEVDPGQDGARRRSIYLQQRRTQVLTLLELFDVPAIISTCSVRNTSTVPLQSLALLNSDFARARANAFARRLETEANGDEQRIELAFRLACGRGPTADEAAAARQFLTGQRGLFAKERDGDHRAWADLCQMILAGNAFLYVE